MNYFIIQNTGIKATKHVYGVEPDLTREGGSIPVTLSLQKATGKNVLLLPVGCGNDGAHSQNEKIDIRNYIEGVSILSYCLSPVLGTLQERCIDSIVFFQTKLLGAYLYEVSQL